MTPEELRAELLGRTKNPHVIERILRLNPKGVKEGTIPRGWRNGVTYRRFLKQTCGMVTRGEVIRRFGRNAWEAIPKRRRYRDGRREWVHLSLLLCVPELPQ